jgi:hypothetical protein
MFMDVYICEYVCVHVFNLTCTQIVCKCTEKLNYNYIPTAYLPPAAAPVPPASKTGGTDAQTGAPAGAATKVIINSNSYTNYYNI